MKKLITTYLSMSLMIMAFFSCMDEEKSVTTPELQTKAQSEAASYQIGQKHNELADIIINHWSIEETDPESIKNEIDRILQTETGEFCARYGISQKAFNNQIDPEQTYETIKDDIIRATYWEGLGASEVLAEKMVLFVETFGDADGSEEVSDLQAAIIDHKNHHASDLSGTELDIYLQSMDVAIHSVEFWYPVDQGGMGRYDQFGGGATAGRLEAWPGFGKIFTADVVGVAQGAIGAVVATEGAAAAPNPAFGGLPTASVVGLVMGVGSSIKKAI